MDILNHKTTKEKWIENEREYFLNLFLEYEYGFRPINCDSRLIYSIIEEKNENGMNIQKVGMSYEDHQMLFYIFMPLEKKEKFKTFIQIVHPNAEKRVNNIYENYENYEKFEGFSPVMEITKNGFTVILVSCLSIAEDNVGAQNSGIFKTMKCDRVANSWGNLSAWSWGCSKVLDYLYQREEFDVNRVAVIGHSRGGKTALLAGALDKRFYLVISNDSGNSGAALSRGNKGETIKNITDVFGYWFCKNYKHYANNEENLPFDQHMLIGLQAPRHCYVASATEDRWADPECELKSAKLASHYYEIYGLNGLVVPDEIENNKSYNEGYVAYHRRVGKHALTLFDWQMYMQYFKKIS